MRFIIRMYNEKDTMVGIVWGPDSDGKFSFRPYDGEGMPTGHVVTGLGVDTVCEVATNAGSRPDRKTLQKLLTATPAIR